MKHILIIRLSALGDVAMALPVIYSVAKAYPDVRFTLLTQDVASRLVINAPGNLSVCVADVKGRHKGVWGLYRLYKELLEKGVTSVADLHGVLRSLILDAYFRLSGRPVALIDKGRKEKWALTARRNKAFHPLKSSFERYTAVFRRLGFTFAPDFISLFGTEKGNPSDFSDLVPPKKPDEIWIGVAPFAKHQGKIYPLDRMERVLARFSTDSRVRLFLFGGGDREKAVFDDWQGRYPHLVSMAGQHGFYKELSLISHLDVMVSMDSANMHLASLVGVPVVSVWGATHYYAGFLGWKQSPENIAEIKLSCRPCSVFGNRPCFRGDYACLSGISPEQLIKTVEKIVEK